MRHARHCGCLQCRRTEAHQRARGAGFPALFLERAGPRRSVGRDLLAGLALLGAIVAVVALVYMVGARP